MCRMNTHYLEPARTVIGKIGTHRVAAITGKHVSRVYRWMYPKSRGGTGGLIPQADMPALLAYAVENMIDLSPAEFFPAVPPFEPLANRPDKFDGPAAASDGLADDRSKPDDTGNLDPMTAACISALAKRAAELDPDSPPDG